MDRYVVVFGGAGGFIHKIKRRETFNDLYIWDTEAVNETLNSKRRLDDDSEDMPKWIDMNDQGKAGKVNAKKLAIMSNARLDKSAYSGGMNRDIVDIGPPNRRAEHAAEIYGGCLVVHGGLYGEDNRALDDFALYDIAMGMWIRFKEPKRSRQRNTIGARCFHTMTAVQEIRVSYQKRNTRVMWLYKPEELMELDANHRSKLRAQPYFKNSGIFLFGGLLGQSSFRDEGSIVNQPLRRTPQNDLFLIQPAYDRNQKYLTVGAANYKKGVKT